MRGAQGSGGGTLLHDYSPTIHYGVRAMQKPQPGTHDREPDTPPMFANEQELTECFRVELRYFARQQRAMDAADAERALEQTTEHLARLAREYALQLARFLPERERTFQDLP